MGLYLSQSVIPYLKVKVTNKDSTVSFQSCGNPVCKNHKKEMSSAFCSACGGAQTTLTKTVSKPAVDLYELLSEQYGDNLYECTHLRKEKDNTRYVIPNLRNPKGLKVEEYSATDLTVDQRESDLKWFRETFAKEIKALKDSVGEENVSEHWGLVTYSS